MRVIKDTDGTEPLPHNIEAEQQLLGAVLTNNDNLAKIAGRIEPDHFYDPVHQQIFETVRDMDQAGQLASPVTLKPIFENHEGLKELGGLRYLARLAGASIASFAIRDYAEMIVDLAAKRTLLGSFEQSTLEIQNGASGAVTAAKIESVVGGLIAQTSTKPLVRKHSISMINAVREINEAYAGTSQVGIPTGIRQLDEKIQNMRPSNLIIIAGRPGMGKTTVAQSIAFDVAASGQGVYFASLEMSGEDLSKRFIARGLSAAGTKIPYTRMIGGRSLERREMEMIVDEGKRQIGLPIWIAERDVRELSRLRASIKRAKQEMDHAGTPLGLVVIDYIQRIRVSGERSTFDEITKSVDMLKTTAMELNVPVLGLAQLNREVERREPPIPMLSDLKQSGSLEEDADVVIFPYREVYYLEQELERMSKNDNSYFDLKADVEAAQMDLDLIVAKQRSGPRGTVKVFADMPVCHVMADKHQQEGNLI